MHCTNRRRPLKILGFRASKTNLHVHLIAPFSVDLGCLRLEPPPTLGGWGRPGIKGLLHVLFDTGTVVVPLLSINLILPPAISGFRV
jgi:hypothetical protein